MNIKLEFGYNCRGYEFNERVVEFNERVVEFDLKEVLKKSLLIEYESEENVCEYFENGLNYGEVSFDKIVDIIIEDYKGEYRDKDGEFMMGDEIFVKIYIDNKLVVEV